MPGWRRLSCEALDANGNPVIVLLTFSGIGPEKPFDWLTQGRLLVKPEREVLEELAEMILSAELVHTGRLRRRPSPVPGGVGREFRPPGTGDRALPVFRVRLPSDSRVKSERIIRPSAVRVHVWRLRFDTDQARLRCEEFGEPVEAGFWP